MNRIGSRATATSLIAGVALVVAATAASATEASASRSAGHTEMARGRLASPPTTVAPTTLPTAATPTTVGAVAAPTTVGGVVAPTTVAGDFVRLVDVTGLLTVEVPDTWVDTDLRQAPDDTGLLHPTISASTDWDQYLSDWRTPGLWYSAYPYSADPAALLEQYSYPVTCTDGGQVPYSDGAFSGIAQTWSNCQDTTGMIRVLIVNPPTLAYTLVVSVQTGSPADEAAYQHIVDTFNVDPSVPLTTETIPPTSAGPTTTLGVPVPPSTVAPTVAPTVVPTVAPTVVPTVAPTVVPTVVPTTAAPGFRVATDDSQTLSVPVPDSWTDIDGAPTTDAAGTTQAALSASPDIAAFANSYDVPGLYMYETTEDVAAALTSLDRTGRCTDAGRQPNPNPAFTGEYQQWLDCEGTATDLYVLAANPVDGRPLTVVVMVQVVQDSDFAAVQAAFTQYAVS